MIANRRKYILLALAISAIGATTLFKYLTGSFLTISEHSKREVQRYTIDFRRHDLTIPSLTSSCTDISRVHDRLVRSTDFGQVTCLHGIATAIGHSPKDSIVLMVFQALMRHAVYSEDKITNDTMTKHVYQDRSGGCEHPVILIFVRDGFSTWLIDDIRGFDRYMECLCPPHTTLGE